MTNQLPEGLTVAPSGNEFVANKIIISDATRFDVLQLISAAAKNEAFEDGLDDEAGDDLYCLQFPNEEAAFYDYDKLVTKMRTLKYPEAYEGE